MPAVATEAADNDTPFGSDDEGNEQRKFKV